MLHNDNSEVKDTIRRWLVWNVIENNLCDVVQCAEKIHLYLVHK